MQGLRGYQELIANLVPLTAASRSKDLVPYMAVRETVLSPCRIAHAVPVLKAPKNALCNGHLPYRTLPRGVVVL